jgi:hypothetical protein
LLLAVPEALGGWPEAEARVGAELRALGFEVSVEPLAVREVPTAADVRARLEASHTRLALRLSRATPNSTSPPIAVYAPEGAGGELRVRSVAAERVKDTGSADEVALLAAELVYSALIRVAPAPPPEVKPKAAAPAPPRPAKVPAPPVARSPWSAALSAGVTSVAPDAKLGARALVGVRRELGGPLRLDFELAAPWLPAEASYAGGEARLWITDARLGLALHTPVSARLSGELGVGVGGAHVLTGGRARAPYQERTDGSVSGIGAAAAAIGVRLSSTLRLVLRARAAFAASDLHVEFAGDRVTPVARPLLDGLVGLELGPKALAP